MHKLFDLIDRIVEISIVVIFGLLVIVGGMQVFNRYVLNQSLSWSEEFQKFAHIWLVFLTIPIGYRRGSHIGMEFLTRSFSEKGKKALNFFTNLLWLLVAIFIIYYTRVIMNVARFQTSPGLGIRMDFAYLGLFLGGVYLFISILRNITNNLQRIYIDKK